MYPIERHFVNNVNELTNIYEELINQKNSKYETSNIHHYSLQSSIIFQLKCQSQISTTQWSITTQTSLSKIIATCALGLGGGIKCVKTKKGSLVWLPKQGD